MITTAIIGIDGRAVTVTVSTDITAKPNLKIIGLPELSVRETTVRVRSALRVAGFNFPQVTVYLTPADLHKDGTGFDLPIALAILAAVGKIDPATLHGWIVVGELSLTGQIRPIRGVLVVARTVATSGFAGIICPTANATEARLAGVQVRAAATLAELVDALRGNAEWPTVTGLIPLPPRDPLIDWSDVRGKETAKRALEIAAAGGHNVLLVGSPGCGKTMLARRLPTILPPLTRQEALEATTIYSVAGLLPRDEGLMAHPPFRAPHHTCSVAAMVGGGATPRPGEVSLAHGGVLFLDELPEFPRSVLECLRQPLEDGHVTIARTRQVVRFPARFMLVATTTPCPCGFHGSPEHACHCNLEALERYRARADVMDAHLPIRVTVDSVPITRATTGETTETVRTRVIAARDRQYARWGNGVTNATASILAIRARMPLIARESRDAIARVAMTICDLHDGYGVDATDIEEARPLTTNRSESC